MTEELLDAAAALAYAIEGLPTSGSKMTQRAEERVKEAMAMLDTALATTADELEQLRRAEDHADRLSEVP